MKHYDRVTKASIAIMAVGYLMFIIPVLRGPSNLSNFTFWLMTIGTGLTLSGVVVFFLTIGLKYLALSRATPAEPHQTAN